MTCVPCRLNGSSALATVSSELNWLAICDGPEICVVSGSRRIWNFPYVDSSPASAPTEMNDARFCLLNGTYTEVSENTGCEPDFVATESRYGGCLRVGEFGSS